MESSTESTHDIDCDERCEKTWGLRGEKFCRHGFMMCFVCKHVYDGFAQCTHENGYVPEEEDQGYVYR